MSGIVSPESWAKDWAGWLIIECRRSPATIASSNFFYGPLSISFANSFKAAKMTKNLEFSFSTEVITGWRAWRIVDFQRRGNISEKRLQALGTSPVWEPYQANVAICNTDGSHEAPWPTCHCGFWAFKEREHVERSLFETYGGEKGKAIGQIALWGRVLECTHGYRGEYAYPQTLQFVEVEKGTADEVAGLYGVPHSIVKRSEHLKCEGFIVATEYDFDRLYATIKYLCGLEVRVEISRLWEGKKRLDLGKVPPCPHHHN